MSLIARKNREMSQMCSGMRMCMCMLDVRQCHLHPLDAND